MKRSENNRIAPLFVSHGLALVLSIILIGFSIDALMGLQQISSEIYQHPFKVHSAAQKMEIDVLTIRKNMLQIITGAGLREDNKQGVTAAEVELRENLLVIRSSFLGNGDRVDEIESLLNQWLKIRAQVFELKNRGQQTQAEKLANTTGMDVTDKIIAQINYVEAFSEHRAEAFVSESSQMLAYEKNILGILFFVVVLTFAIMGVVTRRFVLQFRQLTRTEKELVNDITQRERMENQVRHLNAELEQRVKERTAELEAFSYSVSHDLQVPLRVIEGFSSILLEDHSQKLNEDGKKLLNTIRDHIDLMAQLIDDILAFSRVGRQELDMQKIDMVKLVNTIFTELVSTWKGRDIKLVLDALPSAYGDLSLLRQVWVNLLSNAIKYTGSKTKAVISVGGHVQGSEIIYYVKDNGVGFDMCYAEKLFGVFQRLHSSKIFKGTGLGLAIVKRIITSHRGRVWAEGKINEGATICFTLPALPL